MVAAYYQHSFVQGEDYSVVLTAEQPGGAALDLTGCTLSSEVRTLSGALAATFGVTVPLPSTGQIILSLSSTQTAELMGRYLHDLRLFDSIGRRSVLISGDLVAVRRVTGAL